MKLTKVQQRLLDQMRKLAAEGTTWQEVPGTVGATVRWSETVNTPPGILVTPEQHIRQPFGTWSDPTYHRLVFVTLLHSGVILGVAPAPWIGRRDQSVPYWLAEAILADPRLALDDRRRLAMAAGRRKAGR